MAVAEEVLDKEDNGLLDVGSEPTTRLDSADTEQTNAFAQAEGELNSVPVNNEVEILSEELPAAPVLDKEEDFEKADDEPEAQSTDKVEVSAKADDVKEEQVESKKSKK